MNQNAPVSTDSTAAHDGYLSEESKKQFTITAGILGAVFFFLQIFAPFFAMLLIMPAFMLGSFHVTSYDILRGGVHENHFYFFAEDERPRVRIEPLRLVRLDLKSIPTIDLKERRTSRWWVPWSESEQSIELEGIGELQAEQPWVLGGGEKPLVVSKTRMWEVDAGKLVPLATYPSLGNISRPFYHEGAPAVIESRPDRLFLALFIDGRWEKTRISMKQATTYRDIEEILQVLTIHDTQHVFLQVGKTLFHKIGLPSRLSDWSDREWDAVGSACSNWQTVAWQGEPVVFIWGEVLKAYRKVNGTWSESFDLAASPLSTDFLPLPQHGSMRFAVSFMPFSVRIYSWMDNGELVLNGTFGRGFPFPRRFMAWAFIPHIVNMIFPLILAIILSGMMLRHRVSSHSYAGETVPFASLTRRALAQLTDGVILAAGMLPLAFYFFTMFERMESEFEPFMFPLYFFGSFLFFFVWAMFLLHVFSFTEGAWGATPGKWLLGIRVVGTDLKPCGFWRALLRNFLKVVDGFFNFMVGILIVAFTKDWQRVGDMAARTIVIRKT
jgi:uncharacterized RDD family membrane protein YckC